MCDSLYFDICFIAVVWNQIFNICESCLYLLLLLQGICSPVSHVALLSLPLDSGWPLLTTKYKIVISSFFSHPPYLLCFTPSVMLFTYSTLTFRVFPVYLYKCVSSLRAGTIYCVSLMPQCQHRADKQKASALI